MMICTKANICGSDHCTHHKEHDLNTHCKDSCWAVKNGVAYAKAECCIDTWHDPRYDVVSDV